MKPDSLHTGHDLQIRPRARVAVATWARGSKRDVAPGETPHGVCAGFPGAMGRAAP